MRVPGLNHNYQATTHSDIYAIRLLIRYVQFKISHIQFKILVMKVYKSILFIVGILTFLACSNNVQVKSREDLNKEIELAMEHYINAIKSLNVDSVADCWAVNSKFIGKKDIDGKEELIDYLTPRYKDVTFLDLDANTLKLDVSDSLAVQLSEFSQTFSVGGGPKTSVTGRQITVWKKENEKWKISLVNNIPSLNDTIH